MEHPYLFFVKLFELIGLDHFAHAYPHVIYSWIVLILLIVLGALAAKNISMIPTKMQNLFEIIVAGIEEFMVSVTGEEGRWLFPLAGTVFLYIASCNLIGLIPGFLKKERGMPMLLLWKSWIRPRKESRRHVPITVIAAGVTTSI